MDEKPEVIEQELEETRSALAEKLDQLGTQLTGTAAAVQETVENVTETVENVTEAVTETVEDVTEAGKTAVQTVVSAFDIRKHAENHPWLVVGGAVLAGFLGGKLLMRGGRRELAESHGGLYMASSGSPRDTHGAAYTEDGHGARHGEHEQAEDQEGGWLHSIGETFGSQLGALKGLALGSLFGVVRDMVVRALPEKIGGELRGVFDDATERMGGKPIQGPVFEDEQQDEHEEQQGYYTDAGSELQSSGKER